MLDTIQAVESYLNVIIGLGILGVSLRAFPKERRRGYRWIWFSLSAVGAVWAILYMVDIAHGLRVLMGIGILKSTIALTLSVILALALQLQIPREK